MTSGAEYRDKLDDKLVDLEDEGYGDFEFEDTEKDTYIGLAIARLYPAVYKRIMIAAQTVTPYGTRSLGAVATDYADRVFLVEDAVERDIVTGWQFRGGSIVNIDWSQFETVNLHYHDAYELPDDEDEDVGIPARYTPLVVLGSLVEALESRHDTGLRGDPPPVGDHKETQLIDRLQARYDKLKEETAMGLPAVQL